jgi:hypothetical protein
MSTERTLQGKIILWTRWLSVIGLVGLLVTAVLIVSDGLSRLLFAYAIPGIFDISQLMIVIAVSSCLPVVCAELRQITIRFLSLGPRVNKLLEAFGAFVTMIIFGLMALELWIYSNELAAGNQTTWLVHIPLSPWWKAVAILIALCFPIQMVIFFNTLRSIFLDENGNGPERSINR